MPGASGWHSHQEMQWFGAGYGVVSLETEGGEWMALPGQALLVASGVRHNLSWVGADTVPSL